MENVRLEESSALRHLCPAASLFSSFNVDGEEDENAFNFQVKNVEREQIPHFDTVFAHVQALPKPVWWIVKPQYNTHTAEGMHLARTTAQTHRPTTGRDVYTSVGSCGAWV